MGGLKLAWSSLDSWVFFGYFPIMILIGVLFAKRASSSMSEFFLSGRSLTIPLLVGTMMASWYDGYSVVGVAEWAWTEGIACMIAYVIPCTLIRIPLAVWIAPLVRGKLPEYVMTVPDLLEYLYDKRSRLVGAILVLSNVLYNGANVLVIAQLLHLLFGMSQLMSLILVGVTVGIYVTASGLWAVAVTDVAQVIIMSLSAGIVAYPVLRLAGGFEGVFNALGNTAPELFKPTGGLTTPEIIAWTLVGMSMYTSPIFYQRFSASESAESARKALLICMPIWLVFSSVMVLIGLSSRAVYPNLKPYEGFWQITLGCLPGGLRGLFASGLVAAVMSTLDSDLLIQSTAIVRDIYGSFIRRDLSDRQMVSLNRIAVVALIVMMLFSTQLWHGGIMKAWYYVSGLLVSGLFVPILFGLFYKKKTATAGFVTVLVGMLGYILWEFVLKTPFGLPAYDVVWGICAVVYLILCRFTFVSKPELKTEEKIGGATIG